MIKVLIERNVSPDMISTYVKNSRQALQQSHVVPGFIKGESYTDIDNPQRRFVLGTWRTRQDWINWRDSDERKELLTSISPILLEPEKIAVLDEGV